MALTKVRRGGTDTGISDSSDATAITIDSSERVGIGITPDTTSHGKSFQINRSVINDDDGGSTHIAQNGYYNSAWKYVENGTAEKITFGLGATTFSNATSNSSGADASLSWVNNMVIDANGIVTTPNIPCFSVTHGSQSWSGSNNEQVIAFASEDIDNGGHFNTSNYRFTAPVAGHYFFTIHANIKAFSTSAAGGPGVFLRKNGSSSTTLFMYVYYTGYKGSSVQGIVNLAKDDYITGAAVNYNSSSFELSLRMSGFLLG